jgi:hypothetical protein
MAVAHRQVFCLPARGKNSVGHSVGTFEVATAPPTGLKLQIDGLETARRGKIGSLARPLPLPTGVRVGPVAGRQRTPPATAGASVVTAYAACEQPAAAKSSQNRAIPPSPEG